MTYLHLIICLQPFPEYQDVDVPYQAFENNVKDFFQNGYGTNTYLNISNGFENGNINFSTGYFNEDGMIPQNNVKKLNASIGGNYKTKRVTFSSSFNYSVTDTKTPPFSAANAANGAGIFFVRARAKNKVAKVTTPTITESGRTL